MTAAPSGRWIALALLLYAVAVLARMPHIVLEGRFWAEEGTVFFAHAWTFDPAQALFLPYAGYLNLIANGAALAARWFVPLRDAPMVTIGIALLFQLLPPLILLTARDAWLRPWPVRLAGLALLLLVPAAEEIWLQSLHCQFELTLACGMILALEIPRRLAPSLAILMLAPLCWPGAIVLMPLFGLRALIDRSPGRGAQTGALVVGSVVQLTFFFSLGPDRAGHVDPAAILAVVTIKHLIVPFVGINTSVGYADRIRAATLAGHVPLFAVVLPLIVFGSVAAVMLRSRAWPALWLLAAAALSAVAAYVGALDGATALMIPRAGIRYSFVPLALTALAVLVLTTRPVLRWPAMAIVAWLLAVGLRSYVAPWPPASDGPDWSHQVDLWHADPAYAMQLWPFPWTLRLPPL